MNKRLKNMVISYKASDNRAITLIALVITIIILLILAGITISQLTNNGLFNKTQQATEESKKADAKETMNIKIAECQIESYTKKQETPTLAYLAAYLEEDKDIEYVHKEARETTSLNETPYVYWNKLYTKLSAYPYEFEINSSLQLASIDGVQIATDDKKEEITTKPPEMAILTFVDGENEYNQKSVKKGTQITLSEEPNKKDGYVFLGWTDENNQNYNNGDTITVIGDMRLHTQWRQQEIVTVPTATGNTSNMFSSQCGSNNYLLYDKNLPTKYSQSNCWISSPGVDNAYIGYNFNQPVVLKEIKIYAQSGNPANLTYSFTVQGMDSNGQWNIIGTEHLITYEQANTFKQITIPIDNDTYYYAYKIANNYSVSGNGQRYWHQLNHHNFRIGELEFNCVK